MSNIKRQALVMVTDTGLRREIEIARTDADVRRIVVGHRVPKLRGHRDGVIVAAFDRLVLDRAADQQPQQWGVGAARDLELVDAGPWDADGAQRRVFALARFGSRQPRIDIVRRAHLAFDRANPMKRSSFVLPFADVRGGKLVASAAGLRAAASRLSQTDIPPTVRARARVVLEDYLD